MAKWYNLSGVGEGCQLSPKTRATAPHGWAIAGKPLQPTDIHSPVAVAEGGQLQAAFRPTEGRAAPEGRSAGGRANVLSEQPPAYAGGD